MNDPHQVHNGPAAHEDLTIKEHLEQLRIEDEHRPGAQSYLDGHGKVCWIPESDADRFISEHGSEHPAEFLREHGLEWQEAFFNRVQVPH